MTITITQGQLRFGEVGPYIEGPPGTALVFQADGRTLKGEAPAPSHGPINRVYWVDQDAAAGGDGSDEAPFNSITDAVAAVTGINYALLLAPFDYSAEPAVTIAGGVTIAFFSFSPQAAGEDPACTLPELVLDDADDPCSVLLRNVSCPLLTAWESVIESDGGSVELAEGAPGSGAFALTVIARGTRQTEISGVADLVQAEGVTLGDLATVPGGNATAVLARDCLIDADEWTVATISLEDCQFGAGTTLDVESISWDDETLNSAALNGVTLTSTVDNITSLSPPVPLYGNGFSGDLTSAAGATTLAQNQWENVTLTGTAQLQTRENILRVSGILDLSNAPNGAICGRNNINGGTSGVGGDAAGATAGAAGGPQSARPWSGSAGSLTGTAGGAGGVGAGTAGTAPTAINSASGGKGGGTQASGDGGGGGGKAGVAAQAAGSLAEAQQPFSAWMAPAQAGLFNTTAEGFWPGQAGRGGSSGGGDGAASGGGGGGGGSSAHQVRIYARYVKVGASTPNGVIRNPGSAGGKGGTSTGGDAGGGSGGGAGGGGEVTIVYDFVIGQDDLVVAEPFTADGGTGGAGGNGTGAGKGGGGGDGAQGGQIAVVNRLTGVRVDTLGGVGTAGAAAVGNAGGAGGVGGTCRATFA
jgi:hypothetical protein